jgi:hypothetical protein
LQGRKSLAFAAALDIIRAVSRKVGAESSRLQYDFQSTAMQVEARLIIKHP